jgi:Family of unknown function (DUF5681)
MTTSSESGGGHGEDGAEPHKKDYQVGYGRPPVEHRFKPGNNANPKGRKKKTQNRKVVIRDLLLEPITVKEGGEVKQMSMLEAVLKKTMSKALAGDHKAALTIIGIAQREGILTPEQEETVDSLSDSDRAIMEDAMKRLAPTPAPTTAARALSEGGQADAA